MINLKVIVIKGNITNALRNFKNKMLKAGIINEFRDRRYYTKPTTARRKQKQDAIRKVKYRLNNDEEQ